MRQFPRKGWDKTIPDIVIEPDGQVWVTITKPAWGVWNAYERIEDLRAKDYGRPGSTRGRARPGPGARSGRTSYRPTERGYHFDESHEYEPKRDPVADQIRIQALLYAHTYRPDIL